MSGAAVYACVAVDALALVDDGEGFAHRDGALRTGSDALLASDTSDIAVLPGSGTRPLVLAAHGDCSRDRHQFEELLRADLDALSAAVAERPVDGNDAVLELQRAECAHRRAVAESQASEGAGVRSA